MLLIADLKNNFDKRIKTFGVALFKIIGCKIGQFKNFGICAARKKIGYPAVLICYFLVHQIPQSGGVGIALEPDGDFAGGKIDFP